MNANEQMNLPANLNGDDQNSSMQERVNQCITQLKMEFRKEVKAQQFKYHKNLLIFASIFLIVLVGVVFLSLWFIDIETVTAMNNANASADKDVDYLKFVVPVLLTMGAFFAAVLGFNRLKDFDDRIAKLGEDLRAEQAKESDSQRDAIVAFRTEMAKDREIQNEARDRFESSLKSEFDSNKNQIETQASLAAEKVLLNRQKEIDQFRTNIEDVCSKAKDEFKENVDKSMQEIKGFQESFSWLSDLELLEVEQLAVAVETVSDAHSRIEAYYNSKNKPQNLMDIVKRIVDKVVNDNLPGDMADYHNLAAELARQDLYHLAVKVSKRGTEKFKYKTILYADLIQYAQKIGEFDTAGEAFAKLKTIDMEKWEWQCFDFSVDYLLAVDEVDEASKIAEKFKEYLPNEERAYECSSNIKPIQIKGEEGMQARISELTKAVNLGINCPICANCLAEIYEVKCDYQNALKYIDLAIRCNIEEQASVNSSFLYYTRARIYDKIFSEDTQREGAKLYAQNAVADYETAINIGRLSQITERLANQRKAILKKHLSEDDGDADLADAKLMYVLHKAASKTGKELEEFIEWALDDDK